ncbi:MAG: VOC family protein [Pseudomonadota bacterium]
MVDIIRRSHGFQLDHVGLGVADTERGVKWVEEQTGASVDLHDPEPGQWYWSGSLAIGEWSFLEIIGPNPDWNGFHPFRALLSTIEKPELLFWYIAISDFKAFQTLAKTKRAKLERVEAVNINPHNKANSAYWRGYIGPGFMTERPNVIEWVQRPQHRETPSTECMLKDFRLANPKADKINSVFKDLGIDTKVSQGQSRIGITLKTPNGEWSIDNAGINWTMPSMLLEMASLWWKTRRSSKQ